MLSDPLLTPPDGAEDGIAVYRDDRCAVVHLHRPHRANAMDRRARRALIAGLRDTETCHVVIVTGSGRHFCSGIDLKERDRDIEAGDHSAFGEWADVNLAVRRHPAVFIAAVNGAALGSGLTLVNCCDLALAAESARFGMPELSFGVYPALAGPSTQISLSRKRAAWMMFTTDMLDASAAEQWGLINEVVPASDLLPRAVAIARRVAAFDRHALMASKRALAVRI